MDSIETKARFTALVQNLVKPSADIIENLSPRKVNLWHMATGIATEAGEIVSEIKKHVIYGKELDNNIIKELGDMEFYLEGLRQELLVSRDYILGVNILKLTKRYGEALTYSDKAAQDQVDKN